jgi:hypothetical protein
VVPFNLFYSLYQALEAGVNTLLDPGSGGTVKPIKQSFSILNLTSAGTRTLPSAATCPLGTTVFAFASAAVTVNSTAIEDGGYAVFVRGVDASGVAEWEVLATSAVFTNITALQAGYPLKTVVTDATTSRSLSDADSGKIIDFTSGSAVTVTAPTTLSPGFNCKIVQSGAGLVTVQGDGTMVVNTESAALTTNAQYGVAELVVVATNLANFHTYDISAA